MIGNKSTYTKPGNLKSNMTAAFHMFLESDIFSKIISYDVTIIWRYLGESQKYSNIYAVNQ